jgi:hypothetical protein
MQVPHFELPPLPFSAPQSPEYAGGDAGMAAGEMNEQVYSGVREAVHRNAVVLQVVGDRSPVRVLPLPADGTPVSVSNLLTQTNLVKKMGAIDATLYRATPGSISGIPLDVRMSNDGRSVRAETDYALRPGDRLRVRKTVSPAMQGLVQSVLGL